MPDVFRLCTVFTKKIRLERQYRGHTIRRIGEPSGTASLPRPHLRRDVVEHPAASFVGGARDSHVEPRVIDEHHEVGAAGFNELEHPAFKTQKVREPGQNFDEAHHSESIQLSDQLDALGAHPFATHAQEPCTRNPFLQLSDERCCVVIPRGLTREDEDGRLCQKAQPRYQMATITMMRYAMSRRRGIPPRVSIQLLLRLLRARRSDIRS